MFGASVRPFVDEQILKSVSSAAKEHEVLISIVLLYLWMQKFQLSFYHKGTYAYRSI